MRKVWIGEQMKLNEWNKIQLGSNKLDYHSPCLDLFSCILHLRNRCTTVENKNQLIQFFALLMTKFDSYSHCLYELAIAANCSRRFRYTGSLKPGWSASRAEPYMRTFWARSNSDIFLGNQIKSDSPKSKLLHLLSGVGGGISSLATTVA